MNHAPGAEEAKRLLMPVGDQDVMSQLLDCSSLALVIPGRHTLPLKKRLQKSAVV